MPIFGIIASSNATPYWLTSIYNSSSGLYTATGSTIIDTNDNVYTAYETDSGSVAIIKQDAYGNPIWTSEINFSSVANVQNISLSRGFGGDIAVIYCNSIFAPGGPQMGGMLLSASTGSILYQSTTSGPSGSAFLTVYATYFGGGNTLTCGQHQSGSIYPAFIMFPQYNGQVTSNVLTFKGPGTGSSGTTVHNAFIDVVQGSGGSYPLFAGGFIGNSSDGRVAAIVKYDSSVGTITWQRQLTESSRSAAAQLMYIYKMSIDSSDNIYVLVGSSAASTCHIVKYNTSGTLQWQRKITDSVGMRNHSIATDTSGNSYFVYDNTNGIVVIKYDTSGTLQWKRQFLSAISTSYDPQINSLPMLDSTQSNLLINWQAYSDAQNGYEVAQTVKIPVDGSRTGTITMSNDENITYQTNTTATDAVGTLTDSTLTGTTASTVLSSALTNTSTSYTATVASGAGFTNSMRGKI